ncbi:unnamed protein product, partial [Hymenolepis diminuta]
FNEAKPEQQESIYSDEAELRSTLAPISNAVQLYISMRCEATFLEETILTKEISRRVSTILPTAEFRGQDLRTACEKILPSKQFCDPRHAFGVDEVVYALSHNLDHQWTAAIITKPWGPKGTLDVAITNNPDQEGLICRIVKDIII